MEFIDETGIKVEDAIKKALEELKLDKNEIKFVIIRKEPLLVRVYKKTKEIEEIENFLKEFFKKFGTKFKIQIYPEDKKTLYINIKTQDLDNVLIGKDGKTLQELSYLLEVLLRRKFNFELKYVFDVNNYKKKREEYIINKAIATAKLALENKLEYTLDPLSAYETRLVISELKKINGIRIEKRGRGRNTRLVIIPNVKWYYYCY